MRSGKYPKRRNSHFLTATSLSQRAGALRLFLGIAVLDLKLPAGELAPEVAFGTRFEEIASALIVWWGARREVLRPDTQGTGLAGNLKETIISAGMMAYSLYERRRHTNRSTVGHFLTHASRHQNPPLLSRRDHQRIWRIGSKRTLLVASSKDLFDVGRTQSFN